MAPSSTKLLKLCCHHFSALLSLATSKSLEHSSWSLYNISKYFFYLQHHTHHLKPPIIIYLLGVGSFQVIFSFYPSNSQWNINFCSVKVYIIFPLAICPSSFLSHSILLTIELKLLVPAFHFKSPTSIANYSLQSLGCINSVILPSTTVTTSYINIPMR
jgi:hypothetical protein